MNAKSTRRMSAAPPTLSDAGADAFVRGAPVHVSTHSPAPELPAAPPPAVAKPGRPRKYSETQKALTIRVSLDCYEDLRFLEYALRKGSIQEIAAELLTRSAASARAEAE